MGLFGQFLEGLREVVPPRRKTVVNVLPFSLGADQSTSSHFSQMMTDRWLACITQGLADFSNIPIPLPQEVQDFQSRRIGRLSQGLNKFPRVGALVNSFNRPDQGPAILSQTINIVLSLPDRFNQ